MFSSLLIFVLSAVCLVDCLCLQIMGYKRPYIRANYKLSKKVYHGLVATLSNIEYDPAHLPTSQVGFCLREAITMHHQMASDIFSFTTR